MRRVSFRTLVLLIELLAFVVAYQCLDRAALVKADAIWLAANADPAVCPQPDVEPNGPEEPA